jgi:oligo-alginate lyase
VSAADTATQVFFTRIGAGDPNFNLRNEPAIMLRSRSRNRVFASVIEPHGTFDGTREFSEGATGVMANVRVLTATDEGTIVEITGTNSLKWTLCIANGAASETAQHRINAGGMNYEWKGNYSLIKN